jgi:predicted nucleic acid-binding protein
MLIVSDTSPLRYLVELGAIEFLPRLYGDILTTPSVLQELSQARFPEVVTRWASYPPLWLLIQSPVQTKFLDILDIGEASALSLAIERHADVLLVDERKATGVAKSNGMRTAGTLAVLRDTALAGLIDFHMTMRRLTTETQFRHTDALIAQVTADFEQEAARRQRG